MPRPPALAIFAALAVSATLVAHAQSAPRVDAVVVEIIRESDAAVCDGEVPSGPHHRFGAVPIACVRGGEFVEPASCVAGLARWTAARFRPLRLAGAHARAGHSCLSNGTPLASIGVRPPSRSVRLAALTRRGRRPAPPLHPGATTEPAELSMPGLTGVERFDWDVLTAPYVGERGEDEDACARTLRADLEAGRLRRVAEVRVDLSSPGELDTLVEFEAGPTRFCEVKGLAVRYADASRPPHLVTVNTGRDAGGGWGWHQYNLENARFFDLDTDGMREIWIGMAGETERYYEYREWNGTDFDPVGATLGFGD